MKRWSVVSFGIVLLAQASAAVAQAPGTGEGTAVDRAAQLAALEAERQTVITEARAAFSPGNPEVAWERFETYITAHPEDQFAAVVFSRALSADGDFDSAMAYLRHHLARHPRSHSAALELSGLLVTLLRFDEAIPYLEGIPDEAGVAYPLAQLNLGKAYRATGRFAEARELYTRALQTGSRTFAEAALCELDMAEGRLDACRQRLAAIRGELGDPPALAQPTILLEYLSGDFDAVESGLRSMPPHADPGSRLRTMAVLLPLARGEVADAEGALARLDSVTVRGERDALTALIQAAAGRPELAISAWRAAGERNPLFNDLGRASRVLLWRPDAVATLQRVLDPHAAGTGSGTAEGTSAAAAPDVLDRVAQATPSETGCCRTADTAPPSIWWLLLPALLLTATTRGTRRSPSRGVVS